MNGGKVGYDLPRTRRWLQHDSGSTLVDSVNGAPGSALSCLPSTSPSQGKLRPLQVRFTSI